MHRNLAARITGSLNQISKLIVEQMSNVPTAANNSKFNLLIWSDYR